MMWLESYWSGSAAQGQSGDIEASFLLAMFQNISVSDTSLLGFLPSVVGGIAILAMLAACIYMNSKSIDITEYEELHAANKDKHLERISAEMKQLRNVRTLSRNTST